MQKKILKSAGWIKPYFVKARLLNVWRTMPFLDVDIIIESLNSYGLPICLDSVATTPIGTDPDSFFKMDQLIDVEDEYVRNILEALAILRPIAAAWGLPLEFDDTLNPPLFMRLYEAGERAMNLQKRRSGGGS